MRKAIAAVVTGVLLLAGQAAAGSNHAVTRIDDRVGATREASSEFAEIGTSVVVAAVIVASDDDSESA